jgi:hypothetical protein
MLCSYLKLLRYQEGGMRFAEQNGTCFRRVWLFLMMALTVMGCSGGGQKNTGETTTATIPGAPTIGVAAASGSGKATVSFAAPSSNGGDAITGYIVTSNPEEITGAGTESPIRVTGLANGTSYTFTVQAVNAVGTGPASAASNSVTPTADGEIGNGKIPDTGQTISYTDTAGEDSDYTITPPSYTKLDADGNALPDSASSWAMVMDNVTGLIWESKTNDGGIHDVDNRYTWYDSDTATNGGNAGTAGNGTDTEDFINALNSAGFGGFNDWRLPNRNELQSLIDYSTYDPAIDTVKFPGVVSEDYWSSTTNANNTVTAWLVYFGNGGVGYSNESYSLYVRAVRGGQ